MRAPLVCNSTKRFFFLSLLFVVELVFSFVSLQSSSCVCISATKWTIVKSFLYTCSRRRIICIVFIKQTKKKNNKIEVYTNSKGKQLSQHGGCRAFIAAVNRANVKRKKKK